MKIKKQRSLIAGLLAVAFAALVSLSPGATAPAYAAASCAPGYACGWEHANYDGQTYGTSFRVKLWDRLQNMASSVWANGTTCARTEFYKSWNYFTGGPYGDFFILNSQTIMHEGYNDSDLTDGAGDQQRINWNDTIEATRFIDCN